MEITYTLNEIDTIAAKVLEHTNSKIMLFDAPMGSGKTTLIKSICKQLGIQSKITSPTFSLVNEYSSDLIDVLHFDLYRLENIDQLYNIGFEDYLKKDIFCLIEWPALSISLLPDYQVINIKIIDFETRFLSFKNEINN